VDAHEIAAGGRKARAGFLAVESPPLDGGGVSGWWVRATCTQPPPTPSLLRRGIRKCFQLSAVDRRSLKPALGMTALARWVLAVAAAGALLLTLVPSGRAQNRDAQPEALSKQRAKLYVQAIHAPLANLEGDVNHLAMLSEACRVEHGAQACGLSDKPLESSKLEDRYSYYVKQPVDAHSKAQGVKVQRRNWQVSSAPQRQ
jgi:hypothetical protein